jgi:RNA polymerase sigma factor (sigma-70 family)
VLVRRYDWLLVSIALRAGLDAEQAAEVAQRVFVTLLERLDRIEQPARVRAWLVTTARRETWRLNRAERLVALHLGDAGDELLQELPAEEGALDDLLLQFEEQQQVREAVAALDERCRQLLTLLFYRPEPAPYAEVAAALGLQEGSIGALRARCLEKLRRILASLS